MTKNILSSKRFWTGAIGLTTGISLVLTGEKSLSDGQFLGELFMTGWSLVQTIIALTSNKTVTVGGKSLS